jgi:DNA-binding HxlR family transcriptional regulator
MCNLLDHHQPGGHHCPFPVKSLERDGIVTRTVYPTNPPRVDYELTERGKTLIVPLHLLWTWAQANRTAIEGARRDFEQQRSKDGASV